MDNSADDLIVTIGGDFGSLSYTGAADDHALTSMDNEASGTAEEATATQQVTLGLFLELETNM